MSSSVSPIPARYHTVTPYLVTKDSAAAIDFYKKAFGAEDLMRLVAEGRVAHAEVKIGNSAVMLTDECAQWRALSPETTGGSPVSLLVYVENVDEVFDRAVAAGAKVESPVQNQFYGDRTGTLLDPFGHKWMIASHVEDVSQEELERRFKELVAARKGE
jgi:PhnB protein